MVHVPAPAGVEARARVAPPWTPRAEARARRAGDLALSALFLATIAAPPVTWLAAPAGSAELAREFRLPAPPPRVEASWEAVRELPASFDAWYGDTFGLRSTLIRWHNIAKLELLGVTPTPELVLGEDGWLFTTVHRSVEVWRGADPLSPRELEVWRRVLEERREWLARRGIGYVFAVASNKESIYPEQMPAGWNRLGPTRLDQLVEHLERRSDFRLLDLRPALLDGKRRSAGEGDVYFELGTHWNDRGALYAYQALVRRVAEVLTPSFAAVAPRPLEAFELRPTPNQGDSWAGRLYMEDRLRQPDVELVFQRRARRVPLDAERPQDVASEIDDPILPRAVVFHDSFGEKLRPLLSEHFSRIVYHWGADFDSAAIERERPDVVIHLMVERGLVGYRPNGSPLDTEQRLLPLFRRSREVLARVDGPGDLEPTGGLRIAPGPAEAPHALALTLPDGGEGAVLLPELAVPRDAWPVIAIDIVSPGEDLLELEFLTEREPTYSRQGRALKLSLHPGRNTLLIRLLVPDLAGRMRLRPGSLPGERLLHALEVRAVRD
jgi:alginate O-acetyltransferase complex protein AlgJ